MPEDVKDVPVKEGEASTVKTEETPKPLTQEDVDRIVQEKVAAKEREWQSKKDKEIANLRRQVAAKAKAVEAATAKLGDDPDIQGVLKQAEDGAELDYYRQQEKQSKDFEKVKAEWEGFVGDLMDTVRIMGVEPTHAELNEAAKVVRPGDRKALKETILATAKKIAERETKGKMTKEFDDLKANLRRELGLDTPDKAVSPTGKGKKPTFEELRNASPDEYEENVKSGKWVGV